jgi:hypothetical protein
MQVNDRIIERAVVVWKRLLWCPQYKATCEHDSREDQERMGMAATMACMIPSNLNAERLNRFGDALADHLRSECEKREYVSLSVDYGPDTVLAACAKAADLTMEFPWKTRTSITPKYIAVSAGYGVEEVYHYPLSNGRWLLVRLCGSDVTKVIELVEKGIDTSFEIEEATAPVP